MDDKAFRWFNVKSNCWETETGHYVISVAASVSDVKLSTTIRVIGTDAPAPEAALPSYESGRITGVSDKEFAALLGRPIPDGKWRGDLELNDPIYRFRYAKTAAARWIARHLEKKIEKETENPDLTELFILNMPIRALAQMTNGRITRAMTEDVLYWANGHFFTGLVRLIAGYFRGRKVNRLFQQELEYGPRDD